MSQLAPVQVHSSSSSWNWMRQKLLEKRPNQLMWGVSQIFSLTPCRIFLVLLPFCMSGIPRKYMALSSARDNIFFFKNRTILSVSKPRWFNSIVFISSTIEVVRCSTRQSNTNNAFECLSNLPERSISLLCSTLSTTWTPSPWFC